MLFFLMVDDSDGEYYVRVLWHPGRTGVGKDGNDEYCRPLLLQQDEHFEGGKEMVKLVEFREMTKGALEEWSRWRQNCV